MLNDNVAWRHGQTHLFLRIIQIALLYLLEVVRPGGLELATFWFVGRQGLPRRD